MDTSSSSSATDAAATITDLLPPSRVARNLELHLAAESGDLALVQSLLSSSPTPGDSDDAGGVDVWYEDPSSANWSALHFAAEQGHAEVVKLLLRHGALWNAVDANGVTAAQVAWSMNHERCYRLIFEEGVRQTFLLSALGAQSEDQDDEPDAKRARTEGTAVTSADGTTITLKPSANDVANDTAKYLSTRLRFVPDPLGQVRCLDQDDNMVMAPWETDIMSLSASLLCDNQPSGFSVLNVGFGLGIIDTLLQKYKPGRHVIIEAHPDAIAYAKQLGFDRMPGVELFEGRWEDWIKDSDADEDLAKMAQLGSFDAVYWDTYSQDYKDIKRFFDALPNLLNGPQSRFSFFHGLGATNQFFYDVYTRISELDLREIGLTTQWHTMAPSIRDEEWAGVKQRYWQLALYYCPIAQLDVWD
ncbi:arginine N-methyltransferase [Moesziomyces antarcticus]|uniref:Related to RMT2 - protein-arginine N-methyltransferase n=2 Tax=Pseudozyma antarctica TaxID=84753 RepID=A0A5C3FRH5_PSEA2|nr:arginine N-methyltransferase [Moesziomyces antarcticus]GAK64878.1 arginine N-methyltransferase [Moesziomyces antarcticus]SPO46137.1 related to RMT2 - protein-arginine N-methyltransferase [Moesziomyces antarcticus]